MRDFLRPPRFGPAGLSESYWQKGYKNALGAVEDTLSRGLEAFEYQCGHGVRVAEKTAETLKEQADAGGLTFSLHAPYYISMSSREEEKRLGSLRYFLQSAKAVRSLGGNRVVFHTGSAGKQSRTAAMEKTIDTLSRARALLDEEGYEDIYLCPETMGKQGQLGTLAEVLALCAMDKRHIPCVDFGHLYARDKGVLQSGKEYAEILDRIGEALADERASFFHIHFSRVEYGESGERKHLNFDNQPSGPPHEPLLELLYLRKLSPVMICESAGHQAEDAVTMKRYYQSLGQRQK
ncbi:TIM barrel protein [Ruminococcaceae bacterium OttesenSCG-928-I18]|nr:TIM barrel protein [Ruminococcaceae bacterium OttesenSCG-928-I18]